MPDLAYNRPTTEGQEIWLEGEYGLIVGEITSVRAEGAYLVLTGRIITDDPEGFTARIPMTIEATP